jgi:two-component system response regulator AtoC
VYAWPGNIRELENAIERAVALARQPILTPEDLPADVCNGTAADWPHDPPPEEQSFFAGTPTLEEVDKRYVRYILSHTQGNISRAAKILDIDRRSLYRMLERFKITPFSKEEAE